MWLASFFRFLLLSVARVSVSPSSLCTYIPQGGVSGFFFFEHVLGYSLVKARTISAGLSIISALSPLLGAILADSVIGKRNIILFGG